MNLNKTLKVSISIQGYTQKPQGKEVAQIRYLKQTLTIQQLIDYISSGHCITHCFEDYDEEFGQSTKKIENFRYTQLIGIDIDDADTDLNSYISSLKYKPTLAYTTFSHNIKGNRYRLLYIFNEKIKGAELYCNVYKWLTQDLNLKDNCMQSCAQQMYGTNANAEWYITDTNYDIPTECFQSTTECKSKVSKSSTQNQVPKSSHKYPSEYNKKEEVHYIGMGTPNKDGYLIYDNAVVKALYSMSPQDFIYYYRQTYDYFTATPLHYENGYALLPDDYCEITRPWYREQVGDKTTTVVRTLRHGDKRKTRMSNTAVIIRKIKNDITFEHLLYILVCERTYYYDNSDKVLTNKELVKIAQWAMGIPVNELNPKQIKHPKFKIDKAYWREQGITPRQAANIVRGMLKSQEIGSMYDFNLTDAENVKIMKDNGLSVSINTLRRWRRENGIEKTNKKNNIHKKEKQMKQDIIKDYYNPQLTDGQNVKLMNENGIKVSINTLRRWRKNNGIQREIGGDRKSNDYKIAKNQVTKNDDLKSSTQNQVLISKSSTQNQVLISKSSTQNQVLISKSSTQNQSAIFKVQNIADKSKCNFQNATSDQSEKSKLQNQSEEIKVQLLTNQSAKIENDTFDHLEELEENIDLNKIPSSITDEKTLLLYANAYLKEMSSAKAWPAYTRNRDKYNKVMKNASSSIKSDVIDNIRGRYKTIETDRIEWIGIHVASILPYDSAYDELYNQGYLPKNSNMYWQQYFKKSNAVCEAV